jgi:hypothetical protein
MQTPFGKECKFFYGDYYRGKNHEECRLLTPAVSAQKWKSTLCKSCPVPNILQANSCQFMNLKGRVSDGILGVGKSMKISAYCEKCQCAVKEPQIGCGMCHPITELFQPKE